MAEDIEYLRTDVYRAQNYYPLTIMLKAHQQEVTFAFNTTSKGGTVTNYTSLRGLFVADEDYSLYDIKDMWMRGGAYTTATSNKIQAFGHDLISGLSNNQPCTLIFDPTEISSDWLYEEVDTTTMQLRIGESITKKTIQVTTNKEVFDNQEGSDIYLLEYYQPLEEQQEQE